jgi:hypothetical protein
MTPIKKVLRDALAATLLLGAAACATRNVDLGQNNQLDTLGPKVDAGTDTSAGRVYGCVDWLDDEIASVRGPSCSGECSNTFGADRFAVANMKDLVAITAGRWLFCGRNPFTDLDDAIGVEFTPGCRIYVLRRDSAGNVVRGTEAPYQASFDISAPLGDTPEMDLHFTAERTVRYVVDATRCPNNVLRLTSTQGTLTLRPVTVDDQPPDSGTPDGNTPPPEF